MISNLPPPAKFYVRRLASKPRALVALQIGLLFRFPRSNVLYELKNQYRDPSSPNPPWQEPLIAKKISLLRQHSLMKVLPIVASQIDPFTVRLVPQWSWKHAMYRLGYNLESGVLNSLSKTIRPLAHGEYVNLEKRYADRSDKEWNGDSGPLHVKITSVRSIEESKEKIEELQKLVEGKNQLEAVGLVLRAQEDSNNNDFCSSPRALLFKRTDGKKAQWKRLSDVEVELEPKSLFRSFEHSEAAPRTEFLS